MAPKIMENINNEIENKNHFFEDNVFDTASLSDIEIQTSDNEEDSEDGFIFEDFIPSFYNIRQLLTAVTGTENLLSVTQLKIRVITRETSLQQLSIYTPALRELILDGSVVSSLRDLGCGLKNLKVLRLNRCNLKRFDSMSGIDTVEELYATDNDLTDISQCIFLPKIKTVDVQRNKIKSVFNVSLLSACTELKNLSLKGNEVCDLLPVSRISEMFSNLQTYDGIILTSNEYREARNENLNQENGRSFMVQFPPRILESRRRPNGNN